MVPAPREHSREALQTLWVAGANIQKVATGHIVARAQRVLRWMCRVRKLPHNEVPAVFVVVCEEIGMEIGQRPDEHVEEVVLEALVAG